MKEHIPEASIPYYVNPKLLQVIHKEVNLDYKVGAAPSGGGGRGYEASNTNNNNSNKNDDDIRDDIAYGTYDD